MSTAYTSVAQKKKLFTEKLQKMSEEYENII